MSVARKTEDQCYAKLPERYKTHKSYDIHCIVLTIWCFYFAVPADGRLLSGCVLDDELRLLSVLQGQQQTSAISIAFVWQLFLGHSSVVSSINALFVLASDVQV